MGDDYVEEIMDEQGHTTRKEVHKGNGWTSVEITSDGGGLPIDDMLGGLGGIIEQIMEAQIQMMAEARPGIQ